MSRFPEPGQIHHPKLEAELLAGWKQERVFEQCIERGQGRPVFSFYEGPPTANGRPGIHHALGRTIKDLFCRYKTMCGFRVDRKAGWDTHGLPVEIEVEKAEGLQTREAIEEFGVENYNAACKASVQKYTALWNELTEKVGYWVDLDDPYVTFDNNYIESIWWLLKELHKKELLYKGHKIHWYSPGTGTVLSSHEVSLGYKEVQDPSVTARFRSADDPNTYFLAWTTTPWTLVSNAALAVGPKLNYVTIQAGEERLILAEARLEIVQGDYEILEQHSGAELCGRRYEPLFEHFANHEQAADCWRVVAADYVSTEDGTGIVHTAPAFGADDHETGKREGLPMLNPVKRDGHFADDVDLVDGLWFKDADKPLIRALKERGLIYDHKTYLHNYPHDWRKGTPLMSYPVESWFVRTSQFKERMVALNKTINWQPESVGRGRFGNWLENNVDWALSRHRYWGTPLPIWVNDNNPDDIVVIGSIEELRTHAGDAVANDAELDLHRPFIDDVTWESPNGGTMRRVPEIIDVWFDSGAMPFAQWHYPFENKEIFERNFPADFIAEGLDQTRGWFYTLHAIAALVMDNVAYKNVVVNGLLLDENGEKMSKSKGNTVDPFEALDKHGADIVRWYLMSASPPWENTRYSERGVEEVRRKLFGTLENVYSFFATYANIDGFDPATADMPVAQRGELDRWIISRLNSATDACREALDDYNPTRAARAVEQFVDELSNWYIRRSRPVFWSAKKATDVSADDKRAAYRTTWECLSGCAQLMAPIAPFYSDWLYRATNPTAEISVHLADYPSAKPADIDLALEARMALARNVVTNALALRNKASINVRQPLSRVLVVTGPGVTQAQVDAVARPVCEEINVDAVEYVSSSGGIVDRSAKANFRVLGKRFGKQMKAVAAAIGSLSDSQIDEFLDAGTVSIDLDGESVSLAGDEIEIQSQGVEGWLVERQNGVTVALDTAITPELQSRGLAREVINRIQNMRKAADFDVTDRIDVSWQCEAGSLADAINQHRDNIAHEVLATNLDSSLALEQVNVEDSFDIAGQQLRIQLQRQSA